MPIDTRYLLNIAEARLQPRPDSANGETIEIYLDGGKLGLNGANPGFEYGKRFLERVFEPFTRTRLPQTAVSFRDSHEPGSDRVMQIYLDDKHGYAGKTAADIAQGFVDEVNMALGNKTQVTSRRFV